MGKLEYDGVLFFLIPGIILLSKCIPKLAQIIAAQFFKMTTKEGEKVQEAIRIQKEMKELSMVDEFAKYAKLQRKLNQLTMDLESSSTARQSLQSKIKMWTIGILYGVVVLVYAILLGVVGTSTPVLVVPKHWFAPIQGILAYPTGIEGAISIPIWTILTRNVISLVLKGY